MKAFRASRRFTGVIAAGGAVFSLMWYLWWEWAHRGLSSYATSIYALDDADEWRYTACSRLVAHGYSLFDQVFSAQPPLLFFSLAAGMRTVGDTIDGARAVEVAFGLITLLTTMWISRRIAGLVAGAASGILLTITPLFLVYSRAVEAEGPMMALGTLAIAFALEARRRDSVALAGVGGLALAGAILTKLFAIELILPFALLLLRGPKEAPRRRFLIVGSLAVSVPVLASFASIAPAAQWDQVFRLHEQASRLALPGLPTVFEVLWRFLTVDPGLSVLAAVGLLVTVTYGRRYDALWLATWSVGQGLMLLAFHPLFPHHPAIILASLGAAAGIGIGVAVEGAQKHLRVPLAIVGLAGVVYVVFLPRLVHDDRHVLVPYTDASALSISKVVHRMTARTDLIATDHLAVADFAHRLVVPTLCDPSNVRLRSGYLSSSVLTASTRRYAPSLVDHSAGIFDQVPQYMRWLQAHYDRRPGPLGTTLFVRR